MPIQPFSGGGGIFQGMVRPQAQTQPPVQTPPWNMGPTNLRDGANAPWMRQALRYGAAEYNQPGNGDGSQSDAGLYEGSVAPGLWDSLEEIDSSHADWDRGINERTYNVDNGEGTTARNVRYRPKDNSFLARLAQQSPGAITSSTDQQDGKTSNSHRIDWSKLPQTKFGPANRVMAYDAASMRGKLSNPNMVYNDPVYGMITPVMNYQSGNDMMKSIPMMLASMGFGAVTGAAPMLSAIRAAQAAGSGNWGGVAGAAGGALGLPSWAGGLTNMAISQMTRNRPTGGG